MTEQESNIEMLSTKEYLKQKRRREYEKAKLIAKEVRIQEKTKIAEEKSSTKAAKDQALWSLLKAGKEIAIENLNTDKNKHKLIRTSDIGEPEYEITYED